MARATAGSVGPSLSTSMDVMRAPLRVGSEERDSTTAQSSARAGNANTHALIVEHANNRMASRSGVGGGAGGYGGDEERAAPPRGRRQRSEDCLTKRKETSA